MASRSPQSGGRIGAPPTVAEGGSLVITVRGGVDEIGLFVPGVGSIRLPVVRGRVEYTLPPQVRGGTVIFISDRQYPDPSGAGVLVVGND